MKHALFAFAGCASLQSAPTEMIVKLPVVRVGNQPPQNTEYVMFYPAGFEEPKTSHRRERLEMELESGMLRY